jgi:hypothetical protein
MAITQNQYTGDGTTVLFTISFPYLEQDHVKASLNGTPTTAFSFANSNTIQFNVAPANGVTILLFRETESGALQNQFFPNSSIPSDSLNNNFTQGLYVAQETDNTSQAALSASQTAVSTANAADANASAAVITANAADANASAAVITANTADSNASAAVLTANTAESNSLEAVSTANSAAAAVASAVLYAPVADLTALGLLTPADGDFFELQDSTGAESDPDITGVPGGLVGDTGLSFRLRYDDPPGEYVFLAYFSTDSETRYLKLSGGTLTGQLFGDNSTSAATPGFAFDGDPNTGVLRPGADELALVTAGTSRLTIDSSGNVAVPGGLTRAGNNVVTVGDTGTVTSTMILDGTIVNADVNASAAIAGTKISPDFGSQTIATTGVFSHALGAAATPSITFTGDLNTGIYSPGADQVAVATNGSARITVDSTGKVGIGTTSPGSSLEINAAAATAPFIAKINTSEAARIDSSGRLLVGTSSARSAWNNSSIGSNILQIERSGDGSDASISICANSGTASPTATAAILYLGKTRGTTAGSTTAVQSGDCLSRVSFQGSDGTEQVEAAKIEAFVDGTPGANDMPGRLVFSTTQDGQSSPNARVRINNLGNVSIITNGEMLYGSTTLAAGTTFALVDLYSGGTVGSFVSGTRQFLIFTNGNVQNSNGSYGTLSDAKLKENIVDASSQWDDLKSIQIRNWNFKAETGHETHRQIGPIAQELETICPGLVFETPDRDEDGNETGEVTKGVNQSVLYMKAVKALQEAMERIEVLEQRLNDAGIN